MSRLRTLWAFLSEHSLLIAISFLLAFIPLYPKLPLFDIIPGYIVRVRLEDFFVLTVFLIWLWQVWKGKIAWKSRLSYGVLAYIVVGLLSSLSAMFITQTVPLSTVHIGKTVLHYIRYIEYFTLLFIAASAIKTRLHLKIVLGVLVITVLAISFYGYGQRHWYWPVYSTMNREFSKGMRLYLTEHARVQSTFGGHYDLSAYLVVVLPALLAGWYWIRRRWIRVIFLISLFAGTWLLIMAGSRSSFGSFVFGVLAVVALTMYRRHSRWLVRVGATLGHGALVLVVLGIMMISFGADMYDRFLQTLEGYPTIHKVYHTSNAWRIKVTGETMDLLLGKKFSQQLSDISKAQKPDNALSLSEAEELLASRILVKSDQQPSPVLPNDVYEEIPDLVTIATTSAEGNIEYIQVERPRVFSDAAMQFGLSAAIRYDTLWPRAIAGFKTNPILGTGYGTLTKEGVGVFTEADSTDNNFLRTLGETGLLGFITFYGVVGYVTFVAWRLYARSTDRLLQIFAVGFIAGTAGLLINAMLIDVFAASKVAFTYWALAGVVIAADRLHQMNKLPTSLTKQPKKQTVKKQKRKSV